ncbi:sporulation protein [Cohnella sp. AR92]|uniref:sporulation protein n=1 Tax=Cohnella sp. AR92 TaxID=648716 RepID=UPI000F8F62CC|nr:sporulation protein [Cohnella sp. AR92]RUS46441.1 sporulation protein [Cohnella sp. AR92]
MTDKSDKAPSRRPSAALSLLAGAGVVLLVVGIVKSPGEAFRASLSGLQVWWQTVFPGLLPPLMLAELLAATGLLHVLAALAEPLTRRLFRLPGAAGWAIAFGWSAGMPAGAREAQRLRERGLVRDSDMDTLLLVSHLPNPFVLVLVIGTGFLHSPAYGWALALGLWVSVVVAGVVWARIAKPPAPATPPPLAQTEPKALLHRLSRIIREAKEEDGRPFGKQIADAVSHAVSVLFAIGGLMMMSSVLLRMLQLAWPEADVWLAVPGLYELHLGAFETGRSALFSQTPVPAVTLLAAVLAWTGWSGLLQARAVIRSDDGFPWFRFLAGRLLHAALALICTYPFAIAAERGWLSALVPSWAQPSERTVSGYASSSSFPLPDSWTSLSETTLTTLASVAVFLLLAFLSAVMRPKRPIPPKPPKGKGSGGSQGVPPSDSGF